ncbi:MAG: PepSY-associated TM helix domain-containing protein [Bacteroidota bacterium]
MDNRKYNIYFHTHTISGIIICALLYVIFFAGSFAFFKEDLSAWQKNSSQTTSRKVVSKNFNTVLDTLASRHKLKGRDIEFSLQKNEVSAYVSMSASHDTTIKKKADKKPVHRKERRGRGRGRDDDSEFFTYNFAKNKSVDYTNSYDIGEFLYRLHFFAQLNAVPIRLGTPFGYLLAGIVSFLFLFALITGLMVHWEKIVSNFFTFRPWSKWKTVWTDLHTALGVIQFPFQFVFAVTGIVLIANVALLAPYTKFLYKGNTEKLYHELEYSDTTKYAYTYQPLKQTFDINEYAKQVEKKWSRSSISLIQIKNFNDANMHLIIQGKPDPAAGFSGTGKIVYRVRDNKVLYEASPTEHSTYVDRVRSTIYHLHFGDYGGRPLRIVYFVLGVMGCLVIISGILIWLVARDKNSVPPKKRAFNLWTANIFMASCLSMLPVTAFTMVGILIMRNPGQADIYHMYFYSWLVLGVYFIIRKKLDVTNKQSLWLSAILCLLVPIMDGIMRNNWFWNTFNHGAFDILFIDLLFLSLSAISVIVLVKIKQRQRLTEAPR